MKYKAQLESHISQGQGVHKTHKKRNLSSLEIGNNTSLLPDKSN